MYAAFQTEMMQIRCCLAPKENASFKRADLTFYTLLNKLMEYELSGKVQIQYVQRPQRRD